MRTHARSGSHVERTPGSPARLGARTSRAGAPYTHEPPKGTAPIARGAGARRDSAVDIDVEGAADGDMTGAATGAGSAVVSVVSPVARGIGAVSATTAGAS